MHLSIFNFDIHFVRFTSCILHVYRLYYNMHQNVKTYVYTRIYAYVQIAHRLHIHYVCQVYKMDSICIIHVW